MRPSSPATEGGGAIETTDAFDAFYRAYHSDAVRWASGLVGSRAVGEELAQDALLAMSDRFGDIERPGAYLRRTIVNRAASWHRTRTREQLRVERATAGEPSHYTQATNEMLDALQILPYNQRHLLTHRSTPSRPGADSAVAQTASCNTGGAPP